VIKFFSFKVNSFQRVLNSAGRVTFLRIRFCLETDKADLMPELLDYPFIDENIAVFPLAGSRFSCRF